MNATSNILNGKEIAKKYIDVFSKEVALILEGGGRLCLATLQIGESKDTTLYSKAIENLLRKTGASYSPQVFSADLSEKTLCSEIEKLNANSQVTGILVFSPLPKH